MIKIVEKIIPQNAYDIKCPYEMRPEFIVIHNTANDAPAVNEIINMSKTTNEASFHYAVDDVEAVQGLPLNRNGWHAGDGANGDGNRKGIAIEICYSKSGGAKFEKAQEKAAELTAFLLNKFGWDISHVKKHQDFSGKHCPHRTLDDYGWGYFLSLVNSKMLNAGQTVYTVERGDSLWSIAKSWTVSPSNWKVIQKMNQLNSETIVTGQTLTIPCDYYLYSVEKGESLWSIARDKLGNGSRWRMIQKINNINGETISPNQILKIPYKYN